MLLKFFLVSQLGAQCLAQNSLASVCENTMMRQGGSSKGSQGKPLTRSHGQAVLTLMAAVANNIAPLDLVLTDGKEYEILRFRNDLLRVYENLCGREVGAKASVTACHCTALDSVLC